MLGPSALPSPHRFVQEVSLCGHAASSPPQSAFEAHGAGCPADAASASAAASSGLSSASSVDHDDEDTPTASRDGRGEHALADSRGSRFAWTLQMREDHCWIVSSVAPAWREHGA